MHGHFDHPRALVIGLIVVGFTACSETTPDPSAGGAAGQPSTTTGTAGSGGQGGAMTGGQGGATTSGTAGSAGRAGSTTGGIDAGAGRAGGAGSSGAAGSAGRAGAAGSTGGGAGSGGTAGSAGASGNTDAGSAGGKSDASGNADAVVIDARNDIEGGAGDDRCSIANLDPANPPVATTLSGNLGTHDPSLIFASAQYYLFQTGGSQGLAAKTSTNLTAWTAAPDILSPNPAWIASQVTGVTNLWAPDISFFGGLYHLYYSASTFGSNHSCIGHATRAAMNSGAWTDQGAVICSNPSGGSSDNWNAIDPNVIVDTSGKPWLAFGSFWGGLKMIELDAAGARANQDLHAIAARPNNGGALEAPYIVRRCGYYYLFTSFDRCCDGANSTYKIMVGRSTAVSGPYVDQAGTAMMQGGGTLLVQGLDASQKGWHGPGHNAVIFTDTSAYNVYHAYADNGSPTLRISTIAWNSAGWPVSGGP